MRAAPAAVGLLALALGAGGCRSGGEVVRVGAAASLTVAFAELAEGFEADHPGTTVELTFAGTPTVVAQILNGAPLDVFASADPDNMARVVAAGAAAGPPAVFATNRLAIVTASDNPEGIASLADLARPGLVVALAAPEVPAGRYARQALDTAGISIEPATLEPSVRAIVTKVELGEIDAGVVYATDLRPGVTGVALTAGPVPEYPIVALKEREAATAFVSYVLSPAGSAVLAAHGFGPAP